MPFGLGATTLSTDVSPRRARPNGISRGLGPVVQIPTATDPSLGSPVWGAGPSAILVHSRGPWVSGGVAHNVWSLGGT